MKQIMAVTTFLFILLWTAATQAAVTTQEITYHIDGKSFTGLMAWDDTLSQKRPGILVVHEWWGHNAYARKRAKMLAAMGYTAFALDMYGTGKVAAHPKDAQKFMQALLKDRKTAEKRFQTALDLLKKHKSVDPSRIAAIGYCMGGGIVLHAARTGMDLKGVVSFHGTLGDSIKARPGAVKARILVFTGGADPFAPPALVKSFKAEMAAAHAKMTLKVYPGVKHSFTNPDADTFSQKFGLPLGYDKHADEDSWAGMQSFFSRIFK